MILGICCITALFLIGMIAMFALAINKIIKELKELKDNQFDAEQVMKLYEMKFSRPIVTQERADVQCLFQTVELPLELLQAIKEGRVSEKKFVENELVYKFSKMILPYIEYEVDYDVATMSKVAKGRLRVLKKAR